MNRTEDEGEASLDHLKCDILLLLMFIISMNKLKKKGYNYLQFIVKCC